MFNEVQCEYCGEWIRADQYLLKNNYYICPKCNANQPSHKEQEIDEERR